MWTDCSLPQSSRDVPPEYFDAMAKTLQVASGGATVQEGRTHAEERCFRRALFEMTRLYAFHECEVVVLPRVETDLPPGWGTSNTRPYHLRGW